MPIQQVTPIGSTERTGEVVSPAERASALGVFLGFILIIIFIVFGELALRDLNKRFNEYYEGCRQVPTMTLARPSQMNIRAECQIKAFEASRLLVQLPFVAPLLVILVWIRYYLNRKKRRIATMIIYFSFLVVVVWLLIRYAIEIGLFLLRYYPAIGIYIILLSVAILIIWLIFRFQRGGKAS